jgi:hypothetical protein
MTARKRIFNICARVKKRDRQAKRREEKIGAKMRNASLFLFFFSLSLSSFLSLSLMFWIFGKSCEKKKKGKEKEKKNDYILFLYIEH